MDRRQFIKSATATTALSSASVATSAMAQSRAETLLIVSESGPNNLDIHGVGTNVPGYEVAWNCYDRLIGHEMKAGPYGAPYYDRDKFKPELAEDMVVGKDSATFKLRKNATFHDGTPVTAKDVKWSLDRAVTVGGFPTFQMKAGSLEKPEQFVVVDDHTVRVDFLRPDRLTIPDLAVVVPCVLNSELVKKNATPNDPWGLEYTKQNTAGSGPYKVTKWTPGTEVIFERNETWASGPKPKIPRIIWRMVPSAGNRRALLERGDADISYDLPNKDFVELKSSPKLDIYSTPFSNGVQYLGMNVKNTPFDNPKVRQAVAYGSTISNHAAFQAHDLLFQHLVINCNRAHGKTLTRKYNQTNTVGRALINKIKRNLFCRFHAVRLKIFSKHTAGYIYTHYQINTIGITIEGCIGALRARQRYYQHYQGHYPQHK